MIRSWTSPDCPRDRWALGVRTFANIVPGWSPIVLCGMAFELTLSRSGSRFGGQPTPHCQQMRPSARPASTDRSSAPPSWCSLAFLRMVADLFGRNARQRDGFGLLSSATAHFRAMATTRH